MYDPNEDAANQVGAIDEARAKGWENAREYFKRTVTDYIKNNPIQLLSDSELDMVLNDLFENPEDGAAILRNAALDSQGRP
jgi:hypothetical protein